MAAAIAEGDYAYMSYGERRAGRALYHQRFLAAHVEGAEWVVVTPDWDAYIEEITATIDGAVDVRLGGRDGALPAGLTQDMIYGFQGALPQGRRRAALIDEGRRLAAVEVARRGLAKPAAGADAGVAAADGAATPPRAGDGGPDLAQGAPPAAWKTSQSLASCLAMQFQLGWTVRRRPSYTGVALEAFWAVVHAPSSGCCCGTTTAPMTSSPRGAVVICECYRSGFVLVEGFATGSMLRR